ncbi:MAG: hypothetical protein A3D39_00925 [Candidatus Buchananbacteria bacterium RIFCSPHIGHO2_02_FULL_39_17]|nr:MAG: hypothetical protein A3D39_00925 [Candidatus Buchananbacteria bacterium RIFCSPHIGHO2_02_FULL_39_17]
MLQKQGVMLQKLLLISIGRVVEVRREDDIVRVQAVRPFKLDRQRDDLYCRGFILKPEENPRVVSYADEFISFTTDQVVAVTDEQWVQPVLVVIGAGK